MWLPRRNWAAKLLILDFPAYMLSIALEKSIRADQPGVDPLIAFQPIGDPLTGEEGEGPDQMAFLPDPSPLPCTAESS